MEPNEIKLSDEDIKKIVDKVCDELEDRVYRDVGKGIFGLAWKAVVIVAIAIAGYSAAHTGNWFK